MKTEKRARVSPMPKSVIAKFVAHHPVALHLGAHKTATTFVQAQLDAARHTLSGNNVALLVPRDIRAKSDPVLSRAPAHVRFEAAVNASLETKTPKRLIMSEEGIIGSPRQNLTQGELYRDLRARLSSLPKALNHANVTIFFAVRDYGPCFSSCVTTALRSGHRFDHLELRRRLLIMARGWADVIADIRATFPKAKLCVWRYEAFEHVQSEVLARMAGQRIAANQPRVFETLTQRTVETAMPLLAEKMSVKLRRELFREAVRAYPLGPDNPRFSLWSEEEARLLNERYEMDWATILRRFADSVLISQACPPNR